MPSRSSEARRFEAAVARDKKGSYHVAVPFDPNRVWGEKERHHVRGTVDGVPWRGPLVRAGTHFLVPLGAAWVRDASIDVERRVRVSLAPEGPQRDELAPDLAAALAGAPNAAAFFDSLATFYRKGYLRWIDATKRRPDVRAERIAELIELLEGGHKQRPRR